jgi:hypothetical protein
MRKTQRCVHLPTPDLFLLRLLLLLLLVWLRRQLVRKVERRPFCRKRTSGCFASKWTWGADGRSLLRHFNFCRHFYGSSCELPFSGGFSTRDGFSVFGNSVQERQPLRELQEEEEKQPQQPLRELLEEEGEEEQGMESHLQGQGEGGP